MNPVKRFAILLLFLPTLIYGQQSFTLTDVIRMATDSSLDAFRARNLYEAGYWDYRAYQAQKKPSLTLNTTPLSYNRSVSQEYNYTLGRYEFVELQNLYSTANVAVSQNIPFTGGRLYIDSEIGRLQTFGDNEYTQFASVPIRINLVQPIFGYNTFKWQRKIEPLKYAIAQKSYIQSAENISMTIVDYFFNLMAAQIQVEMATTNLANADTLYDIGQKRLAIASITQADVLTLKVAELNARNDLAEANKQLQVAVFLFRSYLKLPNDMDVTLLLPDKMPDFLADFDIALTQAQINNPDLLGQQQSVLEYASNVEQVRRSGLMDASLRASFGLNQQSSNLPDSYVNPLDQQSASIGISIPIIDWGQRKGRYNNAKNTYEAVKLQAEQYETDFRQRIMLAVSNFNMQQDVVTTAYETREASRLAYEITKQRFIIGKSDVNTLSLALDRQDQANINYIQALRLYWTYYYQLRQLTLYDFEHGMTLMDKFDMELNVK